MHMIHYSGNFLEYDSPDYGSINREFSRKLKFDLRNILLINSHKAFKILLENSTLAMHNTHLPSFEATNLIFPLTILIFDDPLTKHEPNTLVAIC